VQPEDPHSYYNVARRIAVETPNAILADQYHNPENPKSHYSTTGPEIWEQTGGRVTDVIMSMGTGGTISGTGRFLKEQNPKIQIIGVDPVGSILLETWQNGRVPSDVIPKTYKVEGIGEDFLPSTLDLSIIDDVIRIGDREAFLWTRKLVREEAIFCGGSSGAALAAAVRHAQGLSPDHLVVVLLPDAGSRYLSKIFDDKWMRENGFLDAAWSEVSLDEVLSARPSQTLISACVTDRMADVIDLLKKHDISQVPALNMDGSLAGLVTEVDLLKHMLDLGHNHSPDETIAEIIEPAESVYPASTPLEIVLPSIVNGEVVLVTDGTRPTGILTKIDVLDFIAQRG
jgi:cystathionine beta-synthase